jgi:hypothetical protein
MGLTMSTGLYRLLRRRFNRIGHFRSPRDAAIPHLKSAVIVLVVVSVLLIGAGPWLVMSIDDSESADSGGVTRWAGEVTGSATASQAVNQDATSRNDGADQRPAVQTIAANPSQAGQSQSSPGQAIQGQAMQRQANAAPEAMTAQDGTTASIEPP